MPYFNSLSFGSETKVLTQNPFNSDFNDGGNVLPPGQSFIVTEGVQDFIVTEGGGSFMVTEI